jgi:hypothetical protein
MSYEFVRPESYWHEKSKVALKDAQLEIVRLESISIYQSQNLAQALKEKNDLLATNNEVAGGARHTEALLKIARLDLSAAQQHLRDLKTLAASLLRGLGV